MERRELQRTTPLKDIGSPQSSFTCTGTSTLHVFAWCSQYSSNKIVTLIHAVMVSNRVTTNISSWDGTISSSDFYHAAVAFAEIWQKFNSTLPQWSWVSGLKWHCASVHQLDGYLSLENVLLTESPKEDCDEGNDMEIQKPGDALKEEFIDIAELVQGNNHEVHYYNFHVIYSHSYGVPVLYFHAFYGDGQPLALHDIEVDLPSNSAKGLTESKWTFITQEEHPHLKRPWCMLHPCGTSEWMKLLFTNGDVSVTKDEVAVERYLLSWFSVVGQVVGLNIPLEMLHS